MLDGETIRRDFPLLGKDNPEKLVYLDNAATTQKPRKVLDKIHDFYTRTNSNIHRGVYRLSREAGREYEEARKAVKDFIGAESDREIVFTGGTTEAVNLVADSFGHTFIHPGDEVVVSEMEHHSNIIPWQRICRRRRASLKVLPFDDDGNLVLGKLDRLLTGRTRMLAITLVSNVLGTVNPVGEIIKAAHRRGIPVLVDAAQGIQHLSLDVREMDCDFLAFSGHKAYAATGIGVLYGKSYWLERMPPYQTGGGMVASVSFEKTAYAEAPEKFEAGTGHIAGALSLAAALQYLEETGREAIEEYEQLLVGHLDRKLREQPGVVVYGRPARRCAVVSFNLEGVHPYDAGLFLDKMGFALRTGTHCAEPVMKHYGIGGALRASPAFYNTREEIDRLLEALDKVGNILRKKGGS